ncbi:hypothetical protein LCGC14_1432430 [marine sediment metagenome]|uniref:Uncharacterized protein n=1 Tax=marine sediment metagenome TaxID=412755 RepID=A0A0F9M3R1_9ZZZZ
MLSHHEWDCQFIKMDLVPYEDGVHTGMKCSVCDITFETWMTDKIRQILKRVRHHEVE